MNNTPFDIVALAASLGGLKALSQVLSDLPADFPAPIALVQHLDRQHPSLMAEILNRRTALSVKQAQGGEVAKPGWVYIAPPNYHLLIELDSTFSLTQTELVNFVRPSADLLFESVAKRYKARAIAVVLTGKGCDGMRGIEAIATMGGTTIAQDEESSLSFGMPGSAIKTGAIDFIVPLSEVCPTLVKLLERA